MIAPMALNIYMGGAIAKRRTPERNLCPIILGVGVTDAPSVGAGVSDWGKGEISKRGSAVTLSLGGTGVGGAVVAVGSKITGSAGCNDGAREGVNVGLAMTVGGAVGVEEASSVADVATIVADVGLGVDDIPTA